MTDKTPTTWPDVRAKLQTAIRQAERRVDHFQGAVRATHDLGERSRLEFLEEHWLGRLQGLTEALELAKGLEMEP